MTTIAERALRHLQHLRVDETSDQLLESLVTGLCAGLERPGQIAYGDDTGGPLRVLTDPAHAELWSLPHCAMWTGGTVPARLDGESDPDYLARARQWIVFPEGMRRGSAAGLIIAAQPHLTGQKRVVVTDRPHDVVDNEWLILVRVRDSETPDLDAVTAAVNAPSVIPGGMRADVIASDAPLWNETTPFTWDSVDLTWDETATTWPP